MKRALHVLIAALLLAGAAQPAGEPWPKVPPPNLAPAPLCPVIRIVDGDTVVVRRRGSELTVRLLGLDAPEKGAPHAAESARFLENLLRGEAVRLVTDPAGRDHDLYGRSLRYLYREPDGLFVNLELIRQGYAQVFTVRPFAHRAAFEFYESRARRAPKGLWPATSAVKGAPAGGSKSERVYITKTGSKYHRAGCRYLSKSRIPISRADAESRGYSPCSVCKP